ncbi:hypothetical protein [Nonomuraea antimicrobica]|uniref:hypothetical protein n=1 Tax=Nonomuraea antimicrobica TaxID=561173 RepID=UPI0031E79F79
MAEHEYRAADITVLEFDAAVLKRPGMYFGVGLDDPRLLAVVLSAVARHALHPATRVAAEHSLSALIDILGDLRFRLTMDQQHAWRDSPPLGYFGSLLGPEWWLPAAVATLCTETSVEMWCSGRGFHQELAGLRPLAAPRVFKPPVGSGTRITFTLNPHNLPPGSAFPTDLESLDPHGQDCVATNEPGLLTIRDHRHDTATGSRQSGASQ